MPRDDPSSSPPAIWPSVFPRAVNGSCSGQNLRDIDFLTFLPHSSQIHQQILPAVLPPKYIKMRPLLSLNCFHSSPGHRQLSPDEQNLHQPPPVLLPRPCVPKSLLSSRDTRAILSKGKSDRVSPPMAIQLTQVQAKNPYSELKELHDLPPSLPLLTCPHFLP